MKIYRFPNYCFDFIDDKHNKDKDGEKITQFLIISLSFYEAILNPKLKNNHFTVCCYTSE